MSQDLIEVHRCFDPGEVHIVRSFLESRGIPCFVLDEHQNTLNWMNQLALGGYKIAVPATHSHEALALLEEYGAQEQAKSSSDVPWLPAGAGAFLITVFASSLYFLTGAFLFKRKKSFIADQKSLPDRTE